MTARRPIRMAHPAPSRAYRVAEALVGAATLLVLGYAFLIYGATL